MFTDHQVRRLEQTGAENSKLAKAWGCKTGAIIVVSAPGNSEYPNITIEVRPQNGDTVTKYDLDISKTRQAERCWWSSWGGERYNIRKNILRTDIKAELTQRFRSLSEAFAPVVIVSQDPRLLEQSLKSADFTLPKEVILVDMLEVLNYHETVGVDDLEQRSRINYIIVKSGGEWVWRIGAKGFPDSVATELLLEFGPRAKERDGDGARLIREQKALEKARKDASMARRKELRKKVLRQAHRRDKVSW
jgi:hypothetical protein